MDLIASIVKIFSLNHNNFAYSPVTVKRLKIYIAVSFVGNSSSRIIGNFSPKESYSMPKRLRTFNTEEDSDY